MLKFGLFYGETVICPSWQIKEAYTAALTSALLYGCESWMSMTEVNPVSFPCVRTLIGVKRTIPPDLCLIEVGSSPLTDQVRRMQIKCITKLTNERDGMGDVYFHPCMGISSKMQAPDALCIISVMTIAIWRQNRRSSWVKSENHTGRNLWHIRHQLIRSSDSIQCILSWPSQNTRDGQSPDWTCAHVILCCRMRKAVKDTN